MAARFRVTRDQVIAFRLASHNLHQRLPKAALVEAAAACGIQNSPPGAAALSLNARVQALGPLDFERVEQTDKTLLQARGPRRAPHFFPTNDLPVFTNSLLPDDEESLREFMLGITPDLHQLGLSGNEMLSYASADLLEALDGHVLPFTTLSQELIERFAQRLSATQREIWESPSPYTSGQSLGEEVILFAFNLLSLQGLVCYAPRAGNEATFVRTDQWLGRALPQMDKQKARAELVQRYLHCYGPSNVDHFSEWSGAASALAQEMWNLVMAELAEVDFEGKPSWLLARDLAQLESPPVPKGARLLPPHDPYLALRDRQTLLQDRALQRKAWKSVGNPGVVIVNGRIVALWRQKRQASRLIVSIQPLVKVETTTKDDIAVEADLVAPFRQCTTAKTVYVA